MTNERFNPVCVTTVAGAVVGILGGMLAASSYEQSLGSNDYYQAANQIGRLTAEAQNLDYTKQVLARDQNTNALPKLEAEIQQRQNDIQTQTLIEHNTHYHPSDALVHSLEFGNGEAIIVGFLFAAAKYAIYRKRHALLDARIAQAQTNKII